MAAQEGAMVKRFHSGRSAQSGVYSALLAAKGFTGIPDVLEASYGGYLSSYSDKPNPKRLTDGLADVWETGKIGYKPHASVTSIHSALDALTHIMQTEKIKADDIESMNVGVSHMTFVHCAWDYKAQGVTAAQMNLFYGLAVMAIDGVAFVEQYREDRLADPLTLDLISRIQAHADPEIDAMGPAFRHAARVTVKTKNGRSFRHEILNRRGSPENPLSNADVEYKFRNVVASCLSPTQINRIIELVARLDATDDAAELLSLLAAPRS
jgi:2-methylcitrate dehydratase PrpD